MKNFSLIRHIRTGVLALLSITFLLSSYNLAAQGIGINTTGTPGDTSAMLDVKSNTKGLLIPRMTTAERNAIVLPANGLLIYNTDCNNLNYNAGTPTAPNWLPVNAALTLAAPGTITGLASVCQNQNGVTYSIAPVAGALTYTWTVPSGATISSGQGSTSVTINFGTLSGDVCVSASNNCGSSSSTCKTVTTVAPPSSAFTWSPSPAVIAQGCTFSPTVSGASYIWSFQGGSPATSTVQNPVVTWSTTGTYSVSLTVTQGGCSSGSTTNNVVVTNCTHGTTTFTANGSANTGSVQTWTVPSSACTVTIEAWGAQGGNTTQAGGKGARMKGDFSGLAGQALSIIVGQQGESRSSYDGGGGGGSFVWVTATSTPLIIAGGGGGGGGGGGLPYAGVDAVTTSNGTNGNGASPGAGTNGYGGVASSGNYWASGGSGWYSAGNAGTGCSNTSTGGSTPLNGGAGGLSGGDHGYNGHGGFGGGGGAQGACNCAGGGGGGGYSGGGPGANCGGGGGGGSYNSGTNQSNSAGIQTGNGQVTITW